MACVQRGGRGRYGLRTGMWLAPGDARRTVSRMTTAAKLVWILIAVMLVFALLGALSLVLIRPA